MRKMLFASASLLASAAFTAALATAAMARPTVTPSPNIILAASEAVGLDVQTQLQTAKQAIAAHDMKTAMAALGHAASMLHGNAAMAPMMVRIEMTEKMLHSGDMAGANQSLDELLSRPAQIGSHG